METAIDSTMSRFVLRPTLLALALVAAPFALQAVDAQQPAPLRIFLRGGPKTHGPATNGQHDGPTWVKEWQPLLESRGAKVEAALTFPTAEQLERTDVLVMFCANGGYIEGEQRAYFEKFLKRGGGIVALHDAVLAREPHWFKTIIGGAWENGVARYFEGDNTYYYVNTEHPITKGAANFTIDDEVYWALAHDAQCADPRLDDAAGTPGARRARRRPSPRSAGSSRRSGCTRTSCRTASRTARSCHSSDTTSRRSRRRTRARSSSAASPGPASGTPTRSRPRKRLSPRKASP